MSEFNPTGIGEQKMKLHDKIADAVADYENRTGIKPKSIYLGDLEITTLLVWAQENNYIFDNETTNFFGVDRPEVLGLSVYVVNDESHFAVC